MKRCPRAVKLETNTKGNLDTLWSKPFHPAPKVYVNSTSQARPGDEAVRASSLGGHGPNTEPNAPSPLPAPPQTNPTTEAPKSHHPPNQPIFELTRLPNRTQVIGPAPQATQAT